MESSTLTIKHIVTNRGFKVSKKIELLREYFKSEFETISKIAESDAELIAYFKAGLTKRPICEHPDCNEEIKMSRDGTFSRCCSKQHSIELSFLEKYGVKNPMHVDIFKDKMRQEIITKYGVDNYSKTPEFSELMRKSNPMSKPEARIKKDSTMLEKYGVLNPLQNKEIAEKVSNANKIYYLENKDTIEAANLEKTGFKNVLNNPEIHKKSVLKRRYNNYYNRILRFTRIKPLFTIEEYHGSDFYDWRCTECNHEFSFKIEDGKIPVCRICNPLVKLPYSTAEKNLSAWLKNYFNDLIQNDKSVLGGKELDIYIPSKNIAIEFNEIYWHSELNGKDKNYHLKKTERCSEKGIQLIHVFEDEWTFSENIVKSIILSKLGIFENRIYARNCKIKEVSNSEKREFLEYNHIQGDDNASVKLGLYHNDELVSIMSFGFSRFNRHFEYEMHRFCSKSGYQIVGGASKLWKYFLNTYNPSSVITYADRRYSNGEFYEKIGFRLREVSSSAPWYFKGNSGLMHRLGWQKHKLKEKLDHFDENLTAWENMQIAGYDRIWDCGNFVFEWRQSE